MKKIIIIGLLLIAPIQHVLAESKLEENSIYLGATATENSYKAIYQLDQANPDVIKKAIRNINNALDDPRLKGKLKIELIAFSGGTEAFLKGSPYEEDLKQLIERDVIVVQCSNSLKERKLNKDQLYDFIGYTPSGNGELIIRASEGWVIVKP
jgi:intracellular sulfur oxidation DsrE/DsrF family protein